MLPDFLPSISRPHAAQVNTEKMRPAKPARGISGEIGCDANFHSGNVEFVDLGVLGRMRGMTHACSAKES